MTSVGYGAPWLLPNSSLNPDSLARNPKTWLTQLLNVQLARNCIEVEDRLYCESFVPPYSHTFKPDHFDQNSNPPPPPLLLLTLHTSHQQGPDPRPFASAGVRHLAVAWGSSQSLAMLDLSSCGLGPEGAQFLAESAIPGIAARSTAPSTLRLLLSGNSLGSAGAESLGLALASVLVFSQLDVSGSQVGASNPNSKTLN